MSTSIPGYTYGAADLARSPLSLEDLGMLEKTVLFTDDDRSALQQAGEVLSDQVDDVLDVWYGFVGSNAHLLAYFAGADGKPVNSYLAAVRERFGQWIRDTCERDYDQSWLDYQEEVALRHHRIKKNKTDDVNAAPDHPAALYDRVHLSHHGDHSPLSGEEGTHEGRGRQDARCLVQIGGPARRAVEQAVHTRQRLLRLRSSISSCAKTRPF